MPTYLGTDLSTISAPAAGTVRYNTTTNTVETYDGSVWVTISSSGKTLDKKLICEDLRFGSSIFYKIIAEGYDWDEINQWCNETFGPPRTGPSGNAHKWFISGGDIFFHEEKHREWFILKWSAA